MDRTISFSELKKAVEDAYEEFKSIKEGEVDPRIAGVDADKFGIAVTLADGTTFAKGDVDIAAPIGAIIKVPMSTILFSQNSFKEMIQKSGQGPMHPATAKPDVRGAKGIRAISAIEPVGDPDSKWDFIENRMIDMMGSAPVLDDKLYEARTAEDEINKEVDTLAKAGFYLYDDAATSIKLYRKAQSMTATASQIAMMGATLAADGVNPVSNKIVFDGAITKRVIGMMAAKGPHKMALPWSVAAGIPARSSFGGLILAVYPGVMSIAAYSPRVMPNGVSVKGAKTIIDIMNKLDISLYDSAALKIDKER